MWTEPFFLHIMRINLVIVRLHPEAFYLMLDTTDIATVRAARLLFDQVGRLDRSFALWVGAGASSWCGYPRWPESADRFHSDFLRYEPEYDGSRGLELLEAESFPELFQTCRDINVHRFNKLLSSSFAPRELSPVYRRFVQAISQAGPTCVLTTNVDELLEKNLPGAATVGRRDLERAFHLLKGGDSFVCKLHGSVSDLQSIVFTTEDYDNLLRDQNYIAFLERILANTSVIFIGYGMQDDYIVSALRRNHDLASLFGDGPHFAVLPSEPAALPPSVRVIRYTPEPHKDHRSSISVVEELGSLRNQQPDSLPSPDHDAEAPRPTRSSSGHDAEAPRPNRSAHLLFHIHPPGTWGTSSTLGIKDQAGAEKQLIIGTGFSDAELPDNRSTAMHDLIVGLLCFDQVVAPVQALGRLHTLIGSDRFWALIREDILTLVNWTHQEGIIFPSTESLASGDLGSLTAYNPDFTKKSVGQAIRDQISPMPGKEEAAERLFAELEPKIREISHSEEGEIPKLVRGLLLRPSIREILGVSGGTPLNSFARWQVFPVLRLANVAKIGAACRILELGSAKLDFGTSSLAGPAFASDSGSEWTDDTASYVVCGRFAADLGQVVLQEPSFLDAVLAFRDTQHGVSLRNEVHLRLAASEGAEVNVAVNSALRAGVPAAALQAARDRFVSLLVSEPIPGKSPPAIWNDKRYAEDAIARWRQQSRRILDDCCRREGIGLYDQCPCGSGEKLKFCCNEALQA